MRRQMRIEGLENKRLLAADFASGTKVVSECESGDDVIVDSNIITAENPDSASDEEDNFDIILVDLLGAAGRDGGEDIDTVQVNGSNTAGEDEPGGDIVLVDLLGATGREGGAGTDTVQVNGADTADEDDDDII